MQTSPAMDQACAALARGLPLPAHVAAQGVTEADLAPGRRVRSPGHAAT